MVTHDPVAASYADRVVFLVDGRVAGHMRRPDCRGRRRPDGPPRRARRGGGVIMTRPGLAVVAAPLRPSFTATFVAVLLCTLDGRRVRRAWSRPRPVQSRRRPGDAASSWASSSAAGAPCSRCSRWPPPSRSPSAAETSRSACSAPSAPLPDRPGGLVRARRPWSAVAAAHRRSARWPPGVPCSPCSATPAWSPRRWSTAAGRLARRPVLAVLCACGRRHRLPTGHPWPATARAGRARSVRHGGRAGDGGGLRPDRRRPQRGRAHRRRHPAR